MFGSTLLVLDELFTGWGIETVYVDAHDNAQWAAALATPADVVFFETPSNPMQDIVDVPDDLPAPRGPRRAPTAL